MNMLKGLSHALIAAVVLNTSTFASADSSDTVLTVYRGADGKLTRPSVKHAKIMRRTAARRGYITLWLTANVPFNPDVHSLTEAENEAQQAHAREVLNEALQPLLDRGHVWHPTDGPLMKGPGCIVRANTAGVARLVRDNRFLHIIATD